MALIADTLPDISHDGKQLPASLTLPLRAASARLNLVLLLGLDLGMCAKDVGLTTRRGWPVALANGVCYAARPRPTGGWELVVWPEETAGPSGWGPTFEAEISYPDEVTQ